MSRVAFVADVHIGNHKVFGGQYNAGINERCRATLDALSAAVIKAEHEKCTDFVILGDLFDTTKPTPQIIAETQKVLRTRMNVWILMGNHDRQSSAPGDHALGPLDGWGSCKVIERPFLLEKSDLALMLIPFQEGDGDDWCPRQVAALAKDRTKELNTFLCVHLGIKDGTEPEFMSKSHDAITDSVIADTCAAYDIACVVAGNWHSRKRWDKNGVTMFQCGALAPTGFDNPGLSNFGTLAIFDNSGWKIHEIPGPRFVKMVGSVASKGDLLSFENASKLGNSVHVRWLLPPAEIPDGKRIVGEWCVKAEVVPNKRDVEELARNASAAAKSSDTLEDAVNNFISELGLEEEEQYSIFNRCRRYLKL